MAETCADCEKAARETKPDALWLYNVLHQAHLRGLSQGRDEQILFVQDAMGCDDIEEALRVNTNRVMAETLAAAIAFVADEGCTCKPARRLLKLDPNKHSSSCPIEMAAALVRLQPASDALNQLLAEREANARVDCARLSVEALRSGEIVSREDADAAQLAFGERVRRLCLEQGGFDEIRALDLKALLSTVW